MFEALRYEFPLLLSAVGLWGLAWGIDAGSFAILPWLVYSGFHLFQMGRVIHGQSPIQVGIWPAIVEHFDYLKKKQENAFSQREATLMQFEQMLKTLPLGVIRLNDHDAIEWSNDSAKHLLKLKPQDKGKPIQQLLRLPEFVNWLEKKQASALKVVMPEAQLYVLQFELLPFLDGHLLLVRDITAEYDLDQVRQDFVANASHELRTPVTVFIGYLETFLAMTDQLPPPLPDAMVQMAQQARRMQQVIEDLLALSSIERMRGLQDEQVVDMCQMVKQLEQEAIQLSRGQHQLKFSAQSQVGICGEPALLRSIFSNLISNAIRYTPEGGQIEVSWCIDDKGQGVFEVKDTGIGIPREHLGRLTERFYRVDTARSRERGGTGLGLAIVKHALEQHGGHLVIESAPQLGSTFRAVLPQSRVIKLS